ncbi:MAG: hypothetical protein Q8L98_08230 [Chlamydiales bacterium]|nr:hypothetical protein [Chlamydiales bacterium]
MSAISDVARIQEVNAEHVKYLSGYEKFTTNVVSLAREVLYRGTMSAYKMTGRFQQYDSMSFPEPDHRGLFVLIHGLRSDPAAWFRQIFLLENRQSEFKTHIFAPVVHNLGICSLEEAARPILEQLVPYISRYPMHPICLLGTSNGGRITLWLEQKLREASPTTPIRISNVAGVHLGTQRMNDLSEFKLTEHWYPESLLEEIKYKSPVATRLIQESSNPALNGHRSYEFFSTVNDLLIPNMDSTLPVIENHEARYYIVTGESHGSVVEAVARQQISSCIEWMQQYAAPSEKEEQLSVS